MHAVTSVFMRRCVHVHMACTVSRLHAQCGGNFVEEVEPESSAVRRSAVDVCGVLVMPGCAACASQDDPSTFIPPVAVLPHSAVCDLAVASPACVLTLVNCRLRGRCALMQRQAQHSLRTRQRLVVHKAQVWKAALLQLLRPQARRLMPSQPPSLVQVVLVLLLLQVGGCCPPFSHLCYSRYCQAAAAAVVLEAVGQQCWHPSETC